MPVAMAAQEVKVGAQLLPLEALRHERLEPAFRSNRASRSGSAETSSNKSLSATSRSRVVSRLDRRLLSHPHRASLGSCSGRYSGRSLLPPE